MVVGVSAGCCKDRWQLAGCGCGCDTTAGRLWQYRRQDGSAEYEHERAACGPAVALTACVRASSRDPPTRTLAAGLST
jgi:hypothetical protein